MQGSGIPRGRTIAAVILLGTLAWLFAPVDLVPNVLAVRSAPVERVVPKGLRDPIEQTVPDGFVRGLVGMLEPDARREAGQYGFSTQIVSINFLPKTRTMEFRLGRLQLWLVLGRVVKVIEG